MRIRLAAATLSLVFVSTIASAQVIRVADLNAREIRALDRDKTVVFLQGGMLEEHGPYLPAFTDGYLSERLTAEVAAGVVAAKPGWKALLFPPVSIGASGYNEIGGKFSVAGTYAVRPSTLRAIYMDLASELGEQGFKWVMVVHVHGSPLHIGALDAAGDFFHATYRGQMVNLWGLIPVIGGWGNAMSVMTDAEKREDGVSLHGGADEHSLMLHLRPNLVAPDYKSAPTVTGATAEASVAAAKTEGWTGYLGAPRIATADLGRQIWNGFSAAALKSAVDILNGTDPATIQRYMSFMLKNPIHQEWITRATERDTANGERQRAWMATASIAAQLPAELQAAMQARDRAFYAVDAAEWERYTAPGFTTVQQDGSFMTRAERLANLRTQAPRPYVPRSREQNTLRGDLAITRFFSGGLWVVEVWTREAGAWMVLSSQVTTARLERK